jgi:hypothetical protein
MVRGHIGIGTSFILETKTLGKISLKNTNRNIKKKFHPKSELKNLKCEGMSQFDILIS